WEITLKAIIGAQSTFISHIVNSLFRDEQENPGTSPNTPGLRASTCGEHDGHADEVYHRRSDYSVHPYTARATPPTAPITDHPIMLIPMKL
ncbi:hypothetical protein, partial [Paraburkholderia sp. SIMBA_054]|uniref:hypothetical protein n=1 Tax=Paraburkholderia sp. SIMBA_054 TaxID=3085795 RepID=UPI00397D6358